MRLFVIMIGKTLSENVTLLANVIQNIHGEFHCNFVASMKIETIEAASLPIIHTYSDRKFCAFFGVGTYEVAVIWYYIKETGLSLLRLLWALYFLKIYPTEDVGSSVVGVDRKTFMKHVKELTKIMNQWLPEVSDECSMIILVFMVLQMAVCSQEYRFCY